MVNLSNNPASIHKVIPIDRLFDKETIEMFDVTEVIWLMSIKPGIRNVQPFIKDRERMEEIEVLSVHVNALPEAQGYISLLSQIHSKIMYPCVVFLEFNNKYRIASWRTIDSVKYSNREILRDAYVSAWIRDPASSLSTKRCINAVTELLLYAEGDIRTIYMQICSAIQDCPPQVIGSKSHMMKILYDLSGKKNHPILKKIDETRRYEVKNPRTRYEKKQYGTSYKCVYEYEDIWYALMNDEYFHRVITSRKYESIEELVYRIDEKYDDLY